MDPINNLNSIMQTLRQRLIDQQEKTAKSRGKTTAQKSGAKQRISIDELKTSIINKTRAIDPDHKNPQLTTQILLESILTWEFGEELLNDPQFEPMRKEIQDTITSDPELAQKLNAFFKG